MKNNEKIKVGISLGDLNGIGIEIILKTFEDSRMTDFCTPILFGSSKVVSYHKKALGLETPIHGIDRLKNAIHNKVNLYCMLLENMGSVHSSLKRKLGASSFWTSIQLT